MSGRNMPFQMAAQFCARTVPSRPCRRWLVFLALWTVFCFLVFRAASRDDLLELTGTGGPGRPGRRAAELAAELAHAGQLINTRELLQKVVETKQPRSALDLGTLSGSGPTSTTELNYFDAELAVDKSPKKPVDAVLRELADQLPNLPLVYLHENKNKNWHLRKKPAQSALNNSNKTCAKFPTVYDLHINNVYWQETETSNGTLYLYGAYLDKRRNNRLGPTIRILGMMNRLEPSVQTYCQMWFAGKKEPVISKVLEYKYIWFKKWGNYKPGLFQPYMLACQIPASHWKSDPPISVSIVEDVCDTATNNLRVIYNPLQPGESKKEFGVCVKGLDFPSDDLSVRLVEWIEMLSRLGADKIFLYNLEVHPNVTKVLQHYVRQGQVDLTPLTLPGYQPNMPHFQHLYLKSKLTNKRQNELIPYNDCLYRNLYRYKYLALLDIDEVIMPLQRDNWSDMMKDVVEASLKVKPQPRASYNFRNVYFMDEMLKAHKAEDGDGADEDSHFFKDIPPYMHMLQHVYRSANYTKPGQYVKCFHDPEKVLILHNHFPLGCLGGVCTSYPVNTQSAHLQHYRADCVSTLKKSCARDYKNASVMDTNIWRFKEPMVAKTTEVLAKLGFFKVPKVALPRDGLDPSAAEYNAVATA